MAPDYRCERCGYETNRKSSLTNHQNRKTSCIKNEKSDYKCKFCHKGFKNNRNLKIHEEISCRKKKKNIKEENTEAGSSSINNTINITNNINNITVHNHITIYGYELPKRSDGSQIEMCSYHEPNLEYVPREIIKRLPNSHDNLRIIFNTIYFYLTHPENRTIGHYNSKDKTCEVIVHGKKERAPIEQVADNSAQQMKTATEITIKTTEDEETILKLQKCRTFLTRALNTGNEKYLVIKIMRLEIEHYDKNRIIEELDPDEIPPKANTKESILWQTQKARDDMQRRFDEKTATMTRDEIGNFGTGALGVLYEFDKLLKKINESSDIIDIPKAEKDLDHIKGKVEFNLNAMAP